MKWLSINQVLEKEKLRFTLLCKFSPSGELVFSLNKSLKINPKNKQKIGVVKKMPEGSQSVLTGTLKIW